MMAGLGLAFLIAASAQTASPPTSPKVTCSSVETPGRPILIIDRIAHIFFDSGSARLSEQGSAVLDRFAAGYDAPAHCHVFISAHADRVGSAGANLELSRRRAEAVFAYLRRRGLTAPITVELFGETRPLVETPDGVPEPQNRNVTLHVSEPPAP